jgi:hypothetical protein
MLKNVIFLTLMALAVLLSACSPISPASILFPTSTATATATAIPTRTSYPTFTPAAKPTSTTTPMPANTQPALPGPYQASLLNPLDTPHMYIQDTCQYLQEKWSSANSTPGTVVMVIMFHKITNETITTPEDISEFNFRQLMKKIHDNGFKAITTMQLDGFLEHNSVIPERSVLLVTDDKHPADYFNGLFRQYWEKWGWPVVNAWISDDKTTTEIWKQQQALNTEGWVDYQAHGVTHTPPIDQNSSDAYILNELQVSIDVFREYFNKAPIAIIWPGGGFTQHSAELARQLGYRLGFTINPRGPLMFNWIPLGDTGDPKRDTWIQEDPVNDPLMVLPRYWDTDAASHLEEVIQIGQEAAAYAQANKVTELNYYDTVCAPAYGSIP